MAPGASNKVGDPCWSIRSCGSKYLLREVANFSRRIPFILFSLKKVHYTKYKHTYMFICRESHHHCSDWACSNAVLVCVF